MKQIVAVFVVLLLLPLTTSAQIILDIENGYGLPGQTNSLVSVNLNNPVDEISGVQVSICDVDDYLYCTGCETTERTSGFVCVCSEVDGCANVLLFDLGGDVFDRGSGPIFTLTYEVSPLAPLGECRVLHPESLNVADENTVPINVVSLQGKFFGCSDDCECEGNLDDDEDQDGNDAAQFKTYFGRTAFENPCNNSSPCKGDFDCDGDVDATDAILFKSDYGRNEYNNPCPTCEVSDWCTYP